MSRKHVSVRYDGFSVDFNIDADLWKKYTMVVLEQYGFGGIKHDIGKHIFERVQKYQGLTKGLETFFDASFIPKPDIDADFETKILPWMRSRTNDELNKLRINSYRAFVFAQGLIDTPIDKRQTIDLDYETLWKRYRW